MDTFGMPDAERKAHQEAEREMVKSWTPQPIYYEVRFFINEDMKPRRLVRDTQEGAEELYAYLQQQNYCKLDGVYEIMERKLK